MESAKTLPLASWELNRGQKLPVAMQDLTWTQRMQYTVTYSCSGVENPLVASLEKLPGPFNCVPYSTIWADYTELLGTPVKPVTQIPEQIKFVEGFALSLY